MRLALSLLALALASACGGGAGKPGSSPPSDNPHQSGIDPHLPGTPVPMASGMSEEQKQRAIFDDVMKAQVHAAEEAERLFPMIDPASPGFSDEKFKRQNMKRRSAREGLVRKYRVQVGLRNGLTLEQVDALVEQGRARGWPMPSPPAF